MATDDKTNMPGQNVPRMKTPKSKGSNPYPMPTYKPGNGPKLPLRDTKPMPSTNLGPANPPRPNEPRYGHNPPPKVSPPKMVPLPNRPNTPDAHVGINPPPRQVKPKVPRAHPLTPPPRGLGTPQVLYGPGGPPGLNKPPGSRRAIGRGHLKKLTIADLASKKLKMKKGG